MRLDNPFFKGGATSDGLLTATGFKTTTGVGNNYLKDDGTVGNPSITETDTLATVTGRGWTTTSPIRSSNYIETLTSSTIYGRLYAGFLYLNVTSNNYMQAIAVNANIKVRYGNANTMTLQFPVATGAWTYTLPQKTGTIAMTSDIVGTSDVAYGATWNGSMLNATRNAIYDKIETISGGGATSLVGLTDVTLATTTNKFVLVANGSSFVSRALTMADLTDGVTSLVGLSDVTGATVTNKFCLLANGSSFISRALTMADVSDATNVAYKNINNNFTTAQTVSGIITASDFAGSSDRRMKKEVEKFAPKYIDSQYVTFKFKSDKKNQLRVGVIAQDLEKNNPEFIRHDNKMMKSVSYIDLHSAEIAYLKYKVLQLESIILNK